MPDTQHYRKESQRNQVIRTKKKENFRKEKVGNSVKCKYKINIYHQLEQFKSN